MPTLSYENWLAEKFWIWSVWTRLTMGSARAVLIKARKVMAIGSFMAEIEDPTGQLCVKR